MPAGSSKGSNTSKEELILAGIHEIEQHGVRNLSMRRVATACGVSCAAPYKHFADKNDFILAVIRYINQQWYALQNGIIEQYPGDVRRQLVEISLAYIKFLVENPHFRSIVMLREANMDSEQIRTKAELSSQSKRLIHEYCTLVEMTPDVELRKTFVVRSLIYGAALMFDNGELEYTPETMKIVEQVIQREFDIG